MERIPVTHAGSLIRPPELLSFLSAIDHGQAYESAAYQAALSKAVTDVVRKQVETGVDIVDDGEMGKPNWITYLYERTSGLESRPIADDASTILPPIFVFAPRKPISATWCCPQLDGHPLKCTRILSWYHPLVASNCWTSSIILFLVSATARLQNSMPVHETHPLRKLDDS